MADNPFCNKNVFYPYQGVCEETGCKDCPWYLGNTYALALWFSAHEPILKKLAKQTYQPGWNTYCPKCMAIMTNENCNKCGQTYRIVGE